MTGLVHPELFRREMQFQPWAFWQLQAIGSTFITDCDPTVFEYAYQTTDAAGREDIRTAIKRAEEMIFPHLGYNIAPRYKEITVPVPRYFDSNLNRMNYISADGRWLTINLSEAKIRKIGVETYSLIETVTTGAPAHLVYSDADGDGIYDTFTATVSTTVTDLEEIQVIFAAGDRLNGAGPSERWRIPATVNISGGVATIKGPYWCLVKPILYQSPLATSALSISTASNFVTSLDIYRRYIDPTGTTTDTAQAKLIWETRPFPAFATCTGCGSSTGGANSQDPAAEAYAIARCGIRDAERGIVSVGEAVYDSTSGEWYASWMSNCAPPSRIEIRYEAGDNLINGQIQPKWISVISRLTAAEIGRRICACPSTNKELYYWQIDRAFVGSAELEKFSMTNDEMNSPFGTRNGHLFAWKQVKPLVFRKGVLG
jgi:hypothetical protein